MFQNNETAAIVVYQTNPVGVEPFSYEKTFFCSNKFVWRKTLSLFRLNGYAAWRNNKRVGRGGDITLAGIGVNLVPRVLSYKQREPGNEVG